MATKVFSQIAIIPLSTYRLVSYFPGDTGLSWVDFYIIQLHVDLPVNQVYTDNIHMYVSTQLSWYTYYSRSLIYNLLLAFFVNACN
jgi:uncharacterized membrane protein YdjX (TVP38/TMEM64 family)